MGREPPAAGCTLPLTTHATALWPTVSWFWERLYLAEAYLEEAVPIRGCTYQRLYLSEAVPRGGCT